MSPRLLSLKQQAPPLSPQCVNVQTDSVKQQIPETPQIKEEPEEQRLKQEEEQLPEFTAECVKSEEQQQTDNSSDTDNDEDWEPPASSSTAQMETEADGDDYNQVQRKDTSTALFSTYKCGTGSHLSGTETAAGSHLSGPETAAGSHLSGPETAAGSHLSGTETAAGKRERKYECSTYLSSQPRTGPRCDVCGGSSMCSSVGFETTSNFIVWTVSNGSTLFLISGAEFTAGSLWSEKSSDPLCRPTS
ncbi:hypothetical protein WMY93_011846 [Mugilogobius chulae]|uniref:Uncharacterized protein n=1 Tax=Mugilogobius chulae TaxID=88201 RepID=A0AAW0P3U4_9GOBI